MKNYTYKQLKELLESGELAEFYDEDDYEKCNVGRVINFDERYVLLQSFTRLGENDRLVLLEIESLVKIVSGGKYLYKIQTLNQLRKGTAFPTMEKRSNLITSVLETSRINKEIVSIIMTDADQFITTGYVTDIDEENESVKIHGLDQYGRYAGEDVLDITEISVIVYNDIENQCIRYLHDLKSEK